MKIKINAILRGADFVADPGDERDIEDSFGAKLIEAGAATLIVEDVIVVEETIQLIEEVKTIEIEETEPVDEYKTFKKKGR